MTSMLANLGLFFAGIGIFFIGIGVLQWTSAHAKTLQTGR